ncbi:MAG: hypothetical protein ABIO82_00570 [Ginsengibacter sp.]
MQNFKDKLYNYEQEPPEGIWNKLDILLDQQEERVEKIHILRHRSKYLFYGLTAAASLVIIFLSSLFFNNKKAFHENSTVAFLGNPDSAQKQRQEDSLNNKALTYIIESSRGKSSIQQTEESPFHQKSYITIAGPEGQPVKISSKVATLIVSADDDYPPKPVWDKKINKWKEIMLSSTISPTATDLLDIVQLSSMHVDN